jgi:uncharacterized membrane protein YbhN (UPF0104 family)
MTEPRQGARHGLLFASTIGEQRSRRAIDAVVLGASTLTLVVIGAIDQPQPGFARSIAAFFATLPDFLSVVWQFCADALVLLALALVVVAAARRRFTILRDLVITGIIALAIATLAGRWVDGDWPQLIGAWRRAGVQSFAALRVAVPASIVLAASPHVVVPMRRVGRWTISAALLATAVMHAATPLGTLAALLAAVMASSFVHLLFGSTNGRPALGDVEAALAGLGIETVTLGVASRQYAGVFTVDATTPTGEQLVVKVYGRDAHDTALLSSLWRGVWFREPGDHVRLGRLQQVEHEAFLTLFARQVGVLTDTVVSAGATERDDAVLVLGTRGSRIERLGETCTAEHVRAAWGALARLHGAGIAHGQVELGNLIELDGEVGIADFRAASVGASLAQRQIDTAQMFVATSQLLDPDEATSLARESLGEEGLGTLLPLMQPAVLTHAQRAALRRDEVDLDDLRTRAAAAAGTSSPQLAQLRRVTIGSVLRFVLPGVALFLLVSLMSGLDWELLADQLRDAAWWLVVFGFLFAQLPRLTQALSTLGASPLPLPLGPVYALQLAVSYINLVVPTSAARMAINIRFFQRQGVPPAGALAAGALDGFVSFICQSVLLVLLLIFSAGTIEVELSSPLDGGMIRVAVIVLICLAAVIIGVLLVPKWRHFVLGWVRRILTEAVSAVRGLRSPRRLALLLGGSFATELLFAMALGVFTRALGWPIGLGELLFINITVSLLAGLMPVPGGIGVAEGALTLGLVRAGMPEEAAFAAVLLSRLSSFYLPPIWGWFSMRWMQRNGHL